MLLNRPSCRWIIDPLRSLALTICRSAARHSEHCQCYLDHEPHAGAVVHVPRPSYVDGRTACIKTREAFATVEVHAAG